MLLRISLLYLFAALVSKSDAADFVCVSNSSDIIPIEWKCDGRPDCADESDEQGCDTSTCVEDGAVVFQSWRCDGVADCQDGSDESNCGGGSSLGMWTCADGWDQIPSDWKCDGFPDCVDRSDENNCGRLSKNITIGDDLFTCANGQQQIPAEWECDGVVECDDGSDEDCIHDEFSCASGDQSIPIDWECDEEPDCNDGSDEHSDCPPKPITKFKCLTGNQEIEFNWVCDGTLDCRDGSDERDGNGCTSKNAFRCSDGSFVALRYKCDGLTDCRDGSDERDCPRFPLPKEIESEFSIGITQFIRFLHLLQGTKNNYRSIKINQRLLKRAIVRSVKAFTLAQNYTDLHLRQIEDMLLENLAEAADLQTLMDKVSGELAGMPAKLAAARKNIASRENDVRNRQNEVNRLKNEIRRKKRKCRKWWIFSGICDWIEGTKRKVRALERALRGREQALRTARDNLRRRQDDLERLKREQARLKTELDAKKKKEKELKATKAALALASVGVKEIFKYVTITNSRSDTLDSELQIQLVSLDQLTIKLKAVVENLQTNTALYRRLTAYDVNELQDKLEIVNEIAKDNDCDIFAGLC